MGKEQPLSDTNRGGSPGESKDGIPEVEMTNHGGMANPGGMKNPNGMMNPSCKRRSPTTIKERSPTAKEESTVSKGRSPTTKEESHHHKREEAIMEESELWIPGLWHSHTDHLLPRWYVLVSGEPGEDGGGSDHVINKCRVVSIVIVLFTSFLCFWL